MDFGKLGKPDRKINNAVDEGETVCTLDKCFDAFRRKVTQEKKDNLLFIIY